MTATYAFIHLDSTDAISGKSYGSDTGPQASVYFAGSTVIVHDPAALRRLAEACTKAADALEKAQAAAAAGVAA